VAAGEELAILDSMELGEAKAAYLRIRAHRELVERRFERQRSLHAAGIVSEQTVLEAETAVRETAADLAAARETLRLLGLPEAEIEGLSWDDPQPSYVAVRSHFAGKVVAREATRGELVTPERVLFTVADLSQVWVWIDVYERDLPHVRLGERVEVRLDAWPDEILTGELAYIADQLEAASRTVRARVDLPNPNGRLKPGLFARVAHSDPGEDAPPPVLAVPRAAVQRLPWLGAPPAQRDEAVVFVRTSATSFERREVGLGQVTDELAEVVFGLEPGEEVVTKGAFLLKSQASADQLGGHHH
jgi:cobalt-zinc-cadmium efflux system membrane fusion protein